MVFTLPIFASLYLVTVRSGQWVPFVSAHIALTLLFAIAAQRLKGAGIMLAPDGIREREYFSRQVYTPVALVDSVIVVRLGDSSSDTISQQMFLVDDRCRTLLRMRGQVWHTDDFWRVVEFYDVPVRVVDDAMTWPQLRRSPFRQNLTRWERHPVMTSVALVILFGIITIPTLLAVVPLISANS